MERRPHLHSQLLDSHTGLSVGREHWIGPKSCIFFGTGWARGLKGVSG